MGTCRGIAKLLNLSSNRLLSAPLGLLMCAIQNQASPFVRLSIAHVPADFLIHRFPRSTIHVLNTTSTSRRITSRWGYDGDRSTTIFVALQGFSMRSAFVFLRERHYGWTLPGRSLCEDWRFLYSEGDMPSFRLKALRKDSPLLYPIFWLISDTEISLFASSLRAERRRMLSR